MPVFKCNNGKYRIGTGKCIYDSKEKATRAYQGYIISEQLASQKISFDYDGTLSTAKGFAMAKDMIDKGNEVYIISARSIRGTMAVRANKLGIPLSHVYATGSNDAKIEHIHDLGIDIHYDNNKDIIDKLDGLGRLFR